MEVITENKIIVIGPQDKYDADIFLALDGKSTKDEVSAFQDWLLVEKGISISVDGKFGPQTKKYWKEYKKEYEGSGPVTKASKVKKSMTSKEPDEKEKKEKEKKGIKWDKVKQGWVSIKDTARELGLWDLALQKLGLTPPETSVPADVSVREEPKEAPESGKMSTTTKVIIGVAALAVIGTIIYVANKNKKN